MAHSFRHSSTTTQTTTNVEKTTSKKQRRKNLQRSLSLKSKIEKSTFVTHSQSLTHSHSLTVSHSQSPASSFVRSFVRSFVHSYAFTSFAAKVQVQNFANNNERRRRRRTTTMMAAQTLQTLQRECSDDGSATTCGLSVRAPPQRTYAFPLSKFCVRQQHRKTVSGKVAFNAARDTAEAVPKSHTARPRG